MAVCGNLLTLKNEKKAFALFKEAWQDTFRTFDWGKALPVPEVAIPQINQLLALV